MLTRLPKKIVLACVVISLSLMPHTSKAMSLEAALQKVIKDNPTLNASRAQANLKAAQGDQVKSGLFPSVTANGSYGAIYEKTLPSRAQFRATPASLGLDVDYTLFDGLKTYNTYKKALKEAGAADLDILDTEQSVLLNTVEAYVSVVRDSLIKKHRQESLALLQELKKGAKTRFEAGEVSITDQHIAESEFQGAAAALRQAEIILEASEGRFFEVVGQAPKNISMPRFTLNTIVPKEESQAVKQALTDNPALRSTLASAEAAEFNKKAAIGGLFPTMEIQGRHDRSFEVSSNVEDQASTSVNLRLSVPIFDGGLRSAQLKESKELLSVRRYEVQGVQQLIEGNVRAAHARYFLSNKVLNAQQAQLEASVAALAGARAEYASGERSLLDVLRVENDLIATKIAVVTAQADRIVNGYALLAVMGKLNPETLKVASNSPKAL